MELPRDPRRAYLTDDPAEDPARARKHALVAEVRRIIDTVALLDPAATDTADLDRAVDDTKDLADRLGQLPSLRDAGGLASADNANAALLERSGITGRANPLAPPLKMAMGENGVTVGHATYTAAYEGPMGCLHGGFVAAAFDDLMGFAQMASGYAGYTGTLTVKMLRPTPLFRRIDYEAWFDRREGRKIFVAARSRDGETQLADAQIVFIAPKDWSRPR